MSLIVYSKSRSFEDHLREVVTGDIKFHHALKPAVAIAGNVYLVHEDSFGSELANWLESSIQKGVVIGLASDQPSVDSMLSFTDDGVFAYFNAYMADIHYEQMLRLLESGQSWFPPALLADVFSLARTAVRRRTESNPLEILTPREKEIARAVSEGKANKLIATDCEISERTVKTHLTNIFKKLQVKDRVALVIYMNR